MKKVYLITPIVVIALSIILAIILSMKNNRPDVATEIAKASMEFKAQPGFRSEPAKKLVPQIKIGMTTEEVETLLGKPGQKKESNGSLFWFYSLFYSQFIDVQFDSDGKVKKIEACAPGLSDTGYYKLEK